MFETVFTAALNWGWDNYGKQGVSSLLKQAHRKWLRAENEKKRREGAKKYAERLYDHHRKIRMLGKSEVTPLENIFTDVVLLDELTAYRRYARDELESLAREHRFRPQEGERVNGLKLAKRPESGHRLYILGKPGAGKTTFLRYLTLQAVTGRLGRTPIFVPLKQWSDSKLSLIDFIVREFDICGFADAQPFVEYLLTSGKAIVLLDGLDEIRQENNERARATTALENFCRKYDQSQCLITCRIAASDYIFPGFKVVELADFTDSQINTFIDNWFGKDKITLKRFRAEFYKPDHENLRELARTPILLTLLCVAFDATMEFPQRRADLYHEAIDALLRKWDASRNIQRDVIYRNLSLRRKEQMFARIAAGAFQEGQIIFPQAQLEQQIIDYIAKVPPVTDPAAIDGGQILRQIEVQHSIFVKRAHSLYSFSHLTFQEYLTARYLVENAHRGTLPRLMHHLGDDRWREVFLLTVSLLDDADEFFELA